MRRFGAFGEPPSIASRVWARSIFPDVPITTVILTHWQSLASWSFQSRWSNAARWRRRGGQARVMFVQRCSTSALHRANQLARRVIPADASRVSLHLHQNVSFPKLGHVEDQPCDHRHDAGLHRMQPTMLPSLGPWPYGLCPINRPYHHINA